MEAKNVDEANERFDAVTYLKGQGVLRMIENYLGEDDFRSGVRISLDRHKWANAKAFDFWRALDEASGRDVTGLATAWITEPGHPLVTCTVREMGGGLTVDLAQQRFFADPGVAPTAQVWPVPLVLRYGTRDGSVRESRFLLDTATGSVELPGATWYFPNGGGAGFYRYALDDRSIALLAGHTSELTPEERLSLIDDQWALARARKATVGQVLGLVAGLTGEDDLYVLRTLAEILAWLSHNAVRPSTEHAFRELADAIFRPQLEALGWENREDDSPDEREKRQLVIGALGHTAAAADVRAEARRRIAAHLDGRTRLQPDVAGPIASVAAIEGDVALYDRYVARMKESQKTDPQEENRFRSALADFRDPAIVDRFSSVIFTDLIRDQDRTLLLLKMAALAHARGAALRTIRDGWDEFIAKMDPAGKQRAVIALGSLTPRALVDEAGALLQAKQSPAIKETVPHAPERIRLRPPTAQPPARDLQTAPRRIRPPARPPACGSAAPPARRDPPRPPGSPPASSWAAWPRTTSPPAGCTARSARRGCSASRSRTASCSARRSARTRSPATRRGTAPIRWPGMTPSGTTSPRARGSSRVTACGCASSPPSGRRSTTTTARSTRSVSSAASPTPSRSSACGSTRARARCP